MSGLGTASWRHNAIGNTIASFQCVAGSAPGPGHRDGGVPLHRAGSYKKARYYTKKLLKSAYIYMTATIVLLWLLSP